MAGVHHSAGSPPRRATLLDGLGFRKTDHFLPRLENAALLQNLDPLEAFEDIALGHDGPEALETAMLRHKIGSLEKGREVYRRRRRVQRVSSVQGQKVALPGWFGLRPALKSRFCDGYCLSKLWPTH